LEQLDEQSRLRKYILGDISDHERAAIEERLLADETYFEEVTMAEENLIQDYADGNLDAPERERFESRFLSSKGNRERVKFARALRKHVNESKNLPEPEKKSSFFDSLKAFFSAPLPITLAVLLIAAIAGFFVWKNYSNNSEVLIALNKAQKNNRPTEARITGFDYAPKTEGTRGNKKDENLYLVSAKSHASEDVLENESAENLHELGRVYLAENNYDEAIKQFEKALGKNPNIAKLHNDLGVAFLEKGRTKNSLEFFTKANEEIEKAIELDKNLTEAYFNRALVTESLNLPDQAREAWENYLKLDSSTQWANEARSHLQKLETNKPVSKTKEEILQDFLEAKQNNDHEKAWQTLSRNREMTTGKLIPQQLAFLFVDAKANGSDGKAKEYLEALDYAGKIEQDKSGDLSWGKLAKFYANVSNDKISSLKQAQDAVKNGYQIYQTGNYQEAKQVFENSKKDFDLSGNEVESKICDYWIGSCLFYSNQIAENLVVYKKLAEFCQKEDYKWLLSQAYARIGYSFASTNQISNALMYPQKSLSLAKALEDESGIRKFSSQIAEEYKSVGRFDEAARYLENLLTVNPAELKWLDYETLSGTFFKQKFYKTAAAFEKEAFNKTVAADSKVNQQISSVNLAIILASQGKYDEAESFINNSLRIARDFGDSENREKSLAYSKLQMAHIKRQAQKCDESLEYYNESITFYDRSEFSLDKYDAYKGRLLCFLAQKNKPAFERELPVIFEMFEKYRTNISEEQNRNSFFNDEQDIYDIAINYAFTENNYPGAFDYSEKSRARSLLDLQKSFAEVSTTGTMPEIKLSKNVAEPLSLAQIQAEMPENVQLLEYSVLTDKVLIWLVAKNGIAVAQNQIPSEILQEKIFTYIELISENKDESEQKNLSKELYKILIAPVKDQLDSNREIFLIPDKFLFRLPFTTLFSDKYLLEDYKISLTPSANVFVICSRKAKELDTGKSETLLSIGNPVFNDVFEDLQRLPMAKEEAVQSAEFYDKPLILKEKDATKEQVMQNLESSDVIHFAGHYVVDEHSPLLSGFVLAGDDKETALLANYEIIGEKLLHTRLIVLSACRTGVEKYYNGEGMLGASRTFLATGVPLVVASQWQVDSEASARLMTDFHRRRKIEKLSTAEALRQSQLAMLRDEKYQQPYYWAAFITLGGYARF
jgi:CHAT domain-containing protein/predicted Zn-dependent protease